MKGNKTFGGVSEIFTSNVTFTENYSVGGTWFCRVGQLVVWSYMGEIKTHAANDLILTVPDGYRPFKSERFVFSVNALTYGNASISTDGTMVINQIEDTTASGRLYASGAYVIA